MIVHGDLDTDEQEADGGEDEIDDVPGLHAGGEGQHALDGGGGRILHDADEDGEGDDVDGEDY